VRRAQLDFDESIVDWLHVAMHVQNLEQMIKGLPDRDGRPSVDALIDGLRKVAPLAPQPLPGTAAACKPALRTRSGWECRGGQTTGQTW
jgi:hypothetical protein